MVFKSTIAGTYFILTYIYKSLSIIDDRNSYLLYAGSFCGVPKGSMTEGFGEI